MNRQITEAVNLKEPRCASSKSNRSGKIWNCYFAFVRTKNIHRKIKKYADRERECKRGEIENWNEILFEIEILNYKLVSVVIFLNKIRFNKNDKIVVASHTNRI